MATLASRIGRIIPDGKYKNYLRMIAFKFLFFPLGSKQVSLGTKNNKVPARIGRLIFSHESLGERENEGYLQHYQLQTGDTVVNAGAYHGYFAIYAAHKVGPNGHVICFEPEPNNIRLLAKNIALNRLNNITIVPCGLWSADTRLPLVSMGSGSHVSPRDAQPVQTIPVCTLDSALAHLGKTSVNLITMDIEGAELEALSGAAATIKNNPTIHLAIASYHIVNSQPTSSAVEEILHGYHLQAITAYPAHPTTYGWH